MPTGIMTPPVLSPTGDTAGLKSPRAPTPEGEKARLKKATREFESLFMYELLKSMRKTVPQNTLAEDAPMAGEANKETYLQLFDIEVARIMARGDRSSMGDLLYRSMEKIVEARFEKQKPGRPIAPLNPADRPPIRLKSEPVSLPPATRKIRPAETSPGPLPLSGHDRRQETDPILRAFGPLIDEAARAHGLDSTLIASVIKAESGGNPRSVSRAGAKGLMQLVDSTAREVGVTDPFDPRQNIQGGARFLKKLLNRYGDLKLALAAYNAGPARVDRYGGIPPYRETQAYVEKVIAFMGAKAAK
jgi:Rod binding domain-containing protein